MTTKYYEAVKTLEELFDQFNEYLFNNEVERPIITISPDTTNGAYGWCTTQKIWKSDEDEYYEINICAEHLNRPIKQVCGTLIHEMVHLHNIYNDIQDTSTNGRYHNKKFKETAEAHGLIIEKDSKYGWTITKLQESTEKWIDENITISGFNLARVKKQKVVKTKKSKTKAYACPCCNTKFYSTHEINATCECGEKFIQYR